MVQSFIPTSSRDLFLIIDIISAFVCIELAASFFVKVSKRGQAWRVNLGWAVVFACFAFLQGSEIPVTYYLPPAAYTDNIQIFDALGLFVIVAMIGMFELFYQRFHKTRYLVTIIGLVMSVLYPFMSIAAGQLLFDVYFIILAIFTISFFVNLFRASIGKVRRNMVLFIASFFILILGDFLNNPDFLSNLANSGNDTFSFLLAGRLIKLASYIAIFGILQALPIFMEVNWRENLSRLYIIHKSSGLPILHSQFSQEPSVEDPAQPTNEVLVAGGLFGITTLLKEISQSSESIKLFDHGDVKILCEYGVDIMIVLYAKEVMRIYWDKLSHLRKSIEELFGEMLKNWSGDVSYFDPIKVLVKNEFQ